MTLNLLHWRNRTLDGNETGSYFTTRRIVKIGLGVVDVLEIRKVRNYLVV